MYAILIYQKLTATILEVQRSDETDINDIDTYYSREVATGTIVRPESFRSNA